MYLHRERISMWTRSEFRCRVVPCYTGRVREDYNGHLIWVINGKTTARIWESTYRRLLCPFCLVDQCTGETNNA